MSQQPPVPPTSFTDEQVAQQARERQVAAYANEPCMHCGLARGIHVAVIAASGDHPEVLICPQRTFMDREQWKRFERAGAMQPQEQPPALAQRG